MIKRRVAPLYVGIFVLALIISIVGSLLAAWITYGVYQNEQSISIGGLFSIFVGLTGIAACSVEIASSFLQAQYTIDSIGMRTYTLKKEYSLKWEDTKEVGITSISVNQISNTYIVYCTTIPLSQKEKNNFLWHRKKRFTDTMYFQLVEKDQIFELLRCIPEQWKYRIQGQAVTYGIMKWSDFKHEIESPEVVE